MPRHKRIIAAVATMVFFGAIATVSQVSFAGTGRWPWSRPTATPCPTPTQTAAPTAKPTATPGTTLSPGTTPSPGTAPTGSPGAPTASPGAAAHQHNDPKYDGDGQLTGPPVADAGAQTLGNRPRPCVPAPGRPTPTPSGPLVSLGDNCDASTLTRHDGNQAGNRCVATAFGEVAASENNPTLLITSAPQRVRVNQAFTIRVSTRNLVRDRFLPAAQAGYYRESSFLNAEGLVRGHFHTACRQLTSRSNAPDPAPIPAFFKATEDGKGGVTPDEVAVAVPGLTTPGIYQCAAWAGDGSHRIPMMQRANQMPAFDAVRLIVTA